jgi:hypothetical protein
MASDPILLIGKLAKATEEHAERVAVYLASGDDVLAEHPITAGGDVRIALDRQEAVGAGALALVVGPSGLGASLRGAPEMPRVPIDIGEIEGGAAEVRLPLDKVRLTPEILEPWWRWCEWYCVSGQVIGPDGCPVPFAEVTVYSVDFLLTKTPRRTVLTDATGHFTACFNWCECRFCCWPCWPFWWWCWPWWWEWDILHVIEKIEAVVPRVPVGPGPVENPALALSRPEGMSLVRGEGFSSARKLEERFEPDQARTDMIRRKLGSPAIRRVFPWWWWCCDDPSICFTVTQNGNTVLKENPAADTRWCFEEGQSVVLVAGGPVITACPPPPPPDHGFLWIRVGGTLVDTIHDGYADGNTGAYNSDMAFWDGLDIYGSFASGVGYYQVNAGQWTGDPARGGTPPGSSPQITPDLYNTVVILHQTTTNAVTVDSVKMGPFNHGGLTGLYATQEQRNSAPAPWPPLPAHNPGDAVIWGFEGRKVNADAASLIGGATSGGVTLSMTAFDASFNPIALPPNPDDHLTLEIDDAGTVTTGHINSVRVYNADHSEVHSTGTGNCPEYQIHPGGYVVLNITVKDDQEHIGFYVVSPEFGHASIGTTTPGQRNYQPPPLVAFPGAPFKAPNTGLKSFGGGTEDIYFYPTESCCYDFRLYAWKRVTNGSDTPSEYTADFWTVLIKIV